MRFAATLLILGLTLATAGCADFYYDLLGRGGWPHQDKDVQVEVMAPKN